jgi:hypothetical protein
MGGGGATGGQAGRRHDDELVREMTVYATADWTGVVVTCKGDAERGRAAIFDRLYAEAAEHDMVAIGEEYRRKGQDHMVQAELVRR